MIGSVEPGLPLIKTDISALAPTFISLLGIALA